MYAMPDMKKRLKTTLEKGPKKCVETCSPANAVASNHGERVYAQGIEWRIPCYTVYSKKRE